MPKPTKIWNWLRPAPSGGERRQKLRELISHPHLDTSLRKQPPSGAKRGSSALALDNSLYANGPTVVQYPLLGSDEMPPDRSQRRSDTRIQYSHASKKSSLSLTETGNEADLPKAATEDSGATTPRPSVELPMVVFQNQAKFTTEADGALDSETEVFPSTATSVERWIPTSGTATAASLSRYVRYWPSSHPHPVS
jgi:hypothetical protein